MHWPRSLLNWLALVHDLVMAGVAFWLAHYLRLDGRLFVFSGHYLAPATGAFMLINMLCCVGFGLYRGLWRYASLQDLFTLTRAVSVALLVFYLGLFWATRMEGLPRSVPIIHWLLMLALLGGPRFAYRLWKDRRLGLQFRLGGVARVPVLLVGADDAAELFIRETRQNPHAPYVVVGLTDEDDTRRGRHVHGIRIYGSSLMLKKIVYKLTLKGRGPQRVVLTEEVEGARIKQLLDWCNELGLPLSRLPRTRELKSEGANSLAVQPIAVEDLLRRCQHVHDRAAMGAVVEGKVVLVTGAGGTIGGELVRQIVGFKPARLVLFEHSEYQLYLIERELVDAGCAVPLHPVLGDVRDARHVEHVFATHKPQIVFHAAALKHVPLAEENPEETLLTNVEGTRLVGEAALRHAAEAMVLISTDKAVHPGNVMGASKRLAEKLLQELQGGATRFLAVRFGNVLGSTGSVVPRFQKQLEAGGPLTVTHPDMTRYFMTVREAVELVIQAAALGGEEQGGLFVLDMGEPVKIDELARQMVRLAGLEEGAVEIVYTGLRPGEKMHEELFYAGEALEQTSHGAIRRVAGGEAVSDVVALVAACQGRQREAALAELRRLVPEFQPEGAELVADPALRAG